MARGDFTAQQLLLGCLETVCVQLGQGLVGHGLVVVEASVMVLIVFGQKQTVQAPAQEATNQLSQHECGHIGW